jgi:hypothetical protein
MTRVAFAIPFIAFALLIGPVAAKAAEQAAVRDQDFPLGLAENEYQPIMDKLVDTAFEKRDFSFLDKKADEYRTNKTRLSGGGWMLNHFYDAFRLAIVDHHAANSENAALRWTRLSPKSPTPFMVYAHLLISHAWICRGTGTADTVTRHGWRCFRRYMTRADKYLRVHEHTVEGDPEYYVLLEGIARGLDWSEPHRNALLSTAMRRFPDYTPIYAHAAPFFLPEWGGSWDAFDSFVELAVTNSRQYSGTQEYARLYGGLACEHCRGNLFETTLLKWPPLLASYREMLVAWPDPSIPAQILYFACEANDKATAREFLTRVNMTHLSAIWTSPEEFNACKNWATSNSINAESYYAVFGK